MSASYTAEQYLSLILKMSRLGAKQRSIARAFGVSQATICRHLKAARWLDSHESGAAENDAWIPGQSTPRLIHGESEAVSR